MKYKYRILSIIFIPFLLFALVGGCGGDSGSSSSAREIDVEGTIADVEANAQVSKNSFFFNRIINFFSPAKVAFAQMNGSEDLSGITVEAVNSENMIVATGTSDTNGNFSFTAPCGVPLTLVFTLQDSSTIGIDNVIFPCSGQENLETSVFLTVSLSGEEPEIEIEENFPPESAEIFCVSQDELEITDEELVVNGNGGPCIITSGGCNISIENSSVELLDCSTCIDTRGNSSLNINTGKFKCEASNKGVRSVGTSSASIQVEVTSEPAGDTDADGITNDIDKCPLTANPDQIDEDSDGVGNACDNCPEMSNPGQEDMDFDGIGDLCDPEFNPGDADGDGITDDTDNCIFTPNSEQIDTDSDNVGDLCDNCPETANPAQENTDGDELGDACDLDADLFISAFGTGVDTRGNSSVNLVATSENDDPIIPLIAIIDGNVSLSAVGNSEADIEADSCVIDEVVKIEKGNGEVNIICDELITE